jgi:UPF0755 protein
MADVKQKRVKPRNGFVELVNALLTLLVLGLLVGGGLFLYGAHSFYAAGPIKADTTFTVQHGANLSAVADQLETQDLIDNRYVFQIGGWFNKKQGALKAGQFKLTANASMADVLKELTEGKPVLTGITIPEGFTIAQVVDKLKQDDQLTGEITATPPEGSVLPDTYNFDPGAQRQTVLDRMRQAMTTKVAEIWAGHAPGLPISTPDQLVTLASIVEKETGVDTERGKVAAVFVNRLKKHMRLQSDPTIIYGITKGLAPLGRPLKRSEVEATTPYNTYQIDGLPPTPIANPGIDALKATANPENTSDIYFVAASTNPSDGHLFASTYAAHTKNVAKLRVLEKSAANAASAEADVEKDSLAAAQAAASGDTSASDATAPDASTATPAPASDTTVTPAPSDQPPALPDASGTSTNTPPPAASDGTTPAPGDQPATTDQSTGATSASDAPIPMPADARPTGADSTTPPATTPSKPTAPTKPKPKPVTPADTFGG